jgi:hypothetical protein
MKTYEADYTYDIEEYGVITVDGVDTIDEAEDLALSQVKEMFPDIKNIQINSIKELNT